MKRKKPDYTNFPGFSDRYDHNPGSDYFIMYPEILEEYWHVLTGAEQKVLDMIIRQTIGWQKEGGGHKTRDAISWKQFSQGIGGRSRCLGTGLAISTVRTAVDGLERKGFIKVLRRNNRPCVFELVIYKSPAEIQREKEIAEAFESFRKNHGLGSYGKSSEKLE